MVVVVLVVVVLVLFERRSGGALVQSLKTRTHSHGYGFSAGPDSCTRGKTHGKPAGYPYPCNTLNAIDIIEKHYPDEDHVLLFDNATTHLKRADSAISARKMPKFTPK